MVRFFISKGEAVNVSIESADAKKPVEEQITISNLTPNTNYSIYCFAEDTALPLPNRMSVSEVKKSRKESKTENKVPSIFITRRQTLHRGFRLFVSSDAPGVVYCAAAAVDYGVPEVEEVSKVGAKAEITEPGK